MKKIFKILSIILLVLFILSVLWVSVKFIYPSYYSAKGTQYLNNGEIEKAEESFKKSAELGSSVGMYKLAELYEFMGNIGLAMEYYEQAAEKGEKRAYCGLERIYRQEDNIDKARTAEQMNRFLNKGCETE
jgi:TPR repeat protein